ncbi:SusD/RagB family nutrient-binding outer membrane lipoprotein [Longibacter salinarum]|nr:SusD/RagB family nutrient-binding outer membrane lipoprotein [Longibacter salinarum]
MSNTRPPRLLVLACTVLLVVPMFFIGCDFGSTNDDPTAPNTINPDLLFTRSLVYGTLRYDVYQRSQHLFGNMYAQYVANLVPNFPTDRYETSGAYDNWAEAFWNTSYAAYGGGANVGENVSNPGINIQQAIELTQDDPQLVNKTAIARIWKVWLLHRVTDAWGDVPYSEAYQGDEGNRTPVYDPQEEIYRDMLAVLEQSAEAIDPSISGGSFRFGDADVLFNDDLTRWRRFANALRLRLAIRASEAAPSLAEQHVRDVLSSGEVMQGNDDSARLIMGTAEGEFVNSNPLSIIAGFGDERVSELAVQILSDRNDPRIGEIADTTITFPRDGVLYRGLPNGLSASELNGIQSFRYSRIGDRFREADNPVPVILYPEVEFLQAEAALRGWASTTAEDHYEAGIRASLEMYGIDDPTTVDNYLQEPNVAWPASGTFEEKLEAIITQKWIAIYTQGFEAWAEQRRTGYPELLTISGQGATGGEVPTRILYPNVERSLNSANVNEAAQRMGGDTPTTRVWWDVD